MAEPFNRTGAKLLAAISASTFAGLVATLPMTLFMLSMQRLLPKWQQYALSPELITNELVGRAGMVKYMDKQERLSTALFSHFSYGAAMGALYTPFGKKLALPSALKGAIFGLVVWVGNYLGLLPVIKISEAAPKQPARRNILMIVAHLIWGTSLGVIEGLLQG